MSWVFSLSQLEPCKKMVLMSLADNANDEGYCWPSIDTISYKSSVSVSSARRHLKALEELGLITKQQRIKESGASNTNGYYLHIGNTIKQPLPPKPEENKGCQIEPPTIEGVSQVTPGGCHSSDRGEGVTAMTPKPSLEPSLTNTNNNAHEEKNSESDIFQKTHETRTKQQGSPMAEDWQPDWNRVNASLLRAGIDPKLDFARIKFDEFKGYWLSRTDSLHPAWTNRFIQHLISQWPHYKRQQKLNQALDKKVDQQVKQIEKQCESLGDDERWIDDLGEF